MKRDSLIYRNYVRILERELVCAMGCTEPIALAFCAAKARSVLGAVPDRIRIEASGNIIKNVRSVVVPCTDGRKGMAAAAAIGVLGGDENAGLQVLASVTPEARAALGEYLERTEFEIIPLESEYLLDMILTVFCGSSSAKVRIAGEHTNIVLIGKNGQVLFDKSRDRGAADTPGAETVKSPGIGTPDAETVKSPGTGTSDAETVKTPDMGTSCAETVKSPGIDTPDAETVKSPDIAAQDYSLLTVSDIYDFAVTCDTADVREVLERQIRLNTAISEEGLRHDYGANIGKVLLKMGSDVRTRACAGAAAGSDARMNGCSMPVVICSGSGNQGMTASLPVIEYAKELGADRDTLLRALIISNLVTIHAKAGIGRLSAYCGAVSAGAGAGAGIAYLHGGDEKAISHTIVNTLAISSGIVCDGAKSSCAAKIATAVETGILGFEMYRNGQQFYDGEGLVVKGVENSIASFSRLGRVGMRETDREIIQMMAERDA